MENILYLGGPNIAVEIYIYNKEYVNARIGGAEKWRKPLAKFRLRQPHFIVCDNGDFVTHEVMGGQVLKRKYSKGRCNIDIFSAQPNASDLWKGIVEHEKFIEAEARSATEMALLHSFGNINGHVSNYFEVSIKAIPEQIEGHKIAKMWGAESIWRRAYVDCLPLGGVWHKGMRLV
ncbi:unnamed protein product [Amaranthus hypochondriacus]